MSKYPQYNKNDTYRENMNYANIQKERRNNEELQEIERDRIAMERLRAELEQEKKLEKERKNQIRRQQYEDYSNYIQQKYNETPQNREKINIKLGSEQRFIRRQSYNQQMENLCLNPTRQANIYPAEPVKNFSEAGRNYQRGYSHGYNILTGETISPQEQSKQKTPRNINKNSGNPPNEQQERDSKAEYSKEKDIQNLNKESEDFNNYQAYMEKRRQKEQEEMYYLQQQREKESQNQNLENQSQVQVQVNPQNFNEYNQYQNASQEGMNLNEIPKEYYMNQKIMQQKEQEFQKQQQIPPENKEMDIRQPFTQKENKKEIGNNNQFDEKNNNILIPHQNEQIAKEYSSQQSYNLKNKIHEEKITEQDYKNYMLSQQKEKVLEKNDQREKYKQYLLNQQNQNINQIMENQKYPVQYKERQKINEIQVPKNENINIINIEPSKSFEEYYKIKNNYNIQERQKIIEQIKNENYQPYPYNPQEMPNYYPSYEQILDEKAFLMYQQQKQMQEMKGREIDGQNFENYQNDYEYQGIPYNSPNNNQLKEKMIAFQNSKMEYLKNKQKNMLSKENIFSESKIQTPQPKYTNETLTKSDKLRLQREYAQFLDTQINEKNMKNKNNINNNNNLETNQNTGNDNEGPNPYQQLRDKHDKLKDIPQDPYSVKNYNISNKSYLTSNPIINPVNSYKFVDKRRDTSGTLQNNGNNIPMK